MDNRCWIVDLENPDEFGYRFKVFKREEDMKVYIYEYYFKYIIEDINNECDSEMIINYLKEDTETILSKHPYVDGYFYTYEAIISD